MERDKGIKFCEKQLFSLRQELLHLKDCQVKFLTFSVITTGAIFGFIGKHGTENISFPFGFGWLLPLVVLLPSWWIFFDKATTFNRTVGYIRIIEKLILGQKSALNFLAWESALAEYRMTTFNDVKYSQLKERLKQIVNLLCFRIPRHYWILINYIFLLLTSFCCVASWLFSIASWEKIQWGTFIFACAAVAFSIFRNIRILRNLVWGKYSDNLNEERWNRILKVE